MKIILLILQLIALLGSIALYLFILYKTMIFEKIKDPSMLLKAVEYYESMELDDKCLDLLNEYLENNPLNVAILSKIAIIYTKLGDSDKVLEYTGKVLAETEEKQMNVPHMISRAHLLRAVSLKAKEKYSEAYAEVNQSLKYTPENNSARKLRRDLRRILKTADSEE